MPTIPIWPQGPWNNRNYKYSPFKPSKPFKIPKVSTKPPRPISIDELFSEPMPRDWANVTHYIGPRRRLY